MKLSKEFMIGTATAAHQVEGNNRNCDAWVMENMRYSNYAEPSLEAMDHYHRFEEDIKAMAQAGYQAYRFSIEWARIEPAKAQFDENEVEHYKKVLECCINNNIVPIVTLHHFTSPIWVIQEGGWEQETVIEYFGNYTAYVMKQLGALIPYVCTINEANIGYQIGKFVRKMQSEAENKESSKGEVQVGINTKSQSSMMDYFRELGQAFHMDPRHVQPFLGPRTEHGDSVVMQAHREARKIIRDIFPDVKVGITLSLHDIQALPGGEQAAQQEWQG